MSFGILDFGVYIPRRRLQRQAVYAANAWFASGLKGLARGERAVASWDEDAITMAVEASRSCAAAFPGKIDAVLLASTSHPFADRQNAGVVKEALNLPDAVQSMDLSGGLRAGTSALLSALLQPGRTTICAAAENRSAKPGSEAELTYGDGSAAFLVGEGEPIATLVGHHCTSVDFIDHFRSSGEGSDYGWEGRWIRDEGYAKVGAQAVAGALRSLGIPGDTIAHLIVPVTLKGVPELFAKATGVPVSAVCDTHAADIGDTGAAHALVMLAKVLETASAGERILLVGYGQGVDVMIFEVTPAIRNGGAKKFSAALARRKAESNYMRHLAFTGGVSYELGARAEQDQKTALTALYRNRKTVLALVGGRCTKTGTIQFPRSDISVSQNERAIGTQEDYPLADVPARIMTFTADSLTFSPDPPSRYGMVEFEGGGRMMAEFVDADEDDIEVGREMRMVFRVKAIDSLRNFKRYFWKAVPVERTASKEN